MDSKIDFSYKLYGPGWAVASLQVEDQKMISEVSYVEDALGDLARGLRCCKENLCDEEERQNLFLVEFHEEPGGTELLFEFTDADTLKIQCTKFEDLLNREFQVETWTTEVSWLEMTKKLVEEMEKILLEHGIIGYKETWVEHDFPLVDFLWLKHFLLNSSPVELKILYGENGHREVVASNAKDELKLLDVLQKAG